MASSKLQEMRAELLRSQRELGQLSSQHSTRTREEAESRRELDELRRRQHLADGKVKVMASLQSILHIEMYVLNSVYNIYYTLRHDQKSYIFQRVRMCGNVRISLKGLTLFLCKFIICNQLRENKPFFQNLVMGITV